VTRIARPGDPGGPRDRPPEDSDDDRDDDGGTSIDDLAPSTDPGRFDQVFSTEDSGLNVEGGFDPVAGPKQAIPRLGYTINYNFAWNPAAQRWEPDTPGATDAGTPSGANTGTPHTDSLSVFTSSPRSSAPKALLFGLGRTFPMELVRITVQHDAGAEFIITWPDDTESKYKQHSGLLQLDFDRVRIAPDERITLTVWSDTGNSVDTEIVGFAHKFE